MKELVVTPDVINHYKDLLKHPEKYGCTYQPLHEVFVKCDEVTPQDILFNQYLNYIKKPLPKVVFYIIMEQEFAAYKGVEPKDENGKGGRIGYRLKINEILL